MRHPWSTRWLHTCGRYKFWHAKTRDPWVASVFAAPTSPTLVAIRRLQLQPCSKLSSRVSFDYCLFQNEGKTPRLYLLIYIPQFCLFHRPTELLTIDRHIPVATTAGNVAQVPGVARSKNELCTWRQTSSVPTRPPPLLVASFYPLRCHTH